MTGVVTWISRVFLPIMYPATLYNGNPLPAGQTGCVAQRALFEGC
jgi:hypothetical protein